MTSREGLDVDDDDDFSDIYKAYSGPLGSNPAKAQNITTTKKRSLAGSDEEEETRDPNAVPTDFTSREAKVWEAKSKATERNWKKRKEEEMICKICGEPGHFTQGCPSTLGANRKSQDFFERVPARDLHVKALFSEGVVNKIEKEIGCKIKIEEKFIIVSGKDRLILRKGVDAVHKIKDEGVNKGAHNRFPEEGEHKGSSSISPVLHSKSVERGSPLTSRLGRSDSQKSNPSPAHITHSRYGRQEKIVEDRVREDVKKKIVEDRVREDLKMKIVEDRVREDLKMKIVEDRVREDIKKKIVEDRVREDIKKLSSGSPCAYGSDGGRGQPSHSKSPAYMRNSYSNSYEDHTQDRGGWNAADRARSNIQLDRNIDYPYLPQKLEELGLQYNREALELARIRDKEEDEENLKNRETLREIWGGYTKKVTTLRSTHATLWEEFLQLEGQKRQQAHQRVTESGFGGYKQSIYAELDGYHSREHSRGRYTNAMDGYPSPRSQEPYDNFQRHRREDFGKPYHRY
ncbi:hypothetical protein CASFOL_008269 [Castilleja foliolosa]|uniref:CCHC-type domain-containing protein n=1 Tax=Castilleja foliolosa TaxID=1961234 RepID=A0ABD3DYH8_9LAMI